MEAIAYRLPPLVPRISGTGSSSSGFVPTPSAQEPGINHERIVDKHGNVPEHPNQRLYDKHTGRLVQDGLSQFVKMWPTPTGKTSPNTKDPDDIVNSDMEPLQPGQKPYDRRTGKPVPSALADMVRKMWPTPTACAHKGSGPVGSKSWIHDQAKGNLKSSVMEENNSGQLSPGFVEWLMGFPRFHTETISHEEKLDSQKSAESIPESDSQEVQSMRRNVEAIGETSCGLFEATGGGNTLHNMPPKGGPGSRNATEEAAESLQGVRSDVHALPQQETRDLLGEVLESIGKTECREAMEGAFTETELLELRDRIRAASQSGGDLFSILREQARMEEQSNPWAGGEWPDQPRVESGVPNRVDRLRGLGNAVVPQVAEWIGRRIVSAVDNGDG